MRRTPIFSFFLALLFALAAPAGEQREISLREKQEQARKLAEEVLTGKELRVRVYNDWQADPRAYELVNVPLDGLSVRFDALKKVFPAIGKSAVIVVAGRDQTDEAVGMVLEGYVYVEPYDEKKTLSIWPRDLSKRQSLETCVFKDSDRQPVPNAEVEIWMGVDPYLESGPRVMIAKVKLDEAGVLQPPRFVSSWRPCFIVQHPDCGPVRAIYIPPSSPDDSYRSFLVPALPKDKWCVFTDAIGDPIPNATVEIFSGGAWRTDRSKSLGKFKLDEKGRLKPPKSDSRLDMCYFIVSHPDYGTAIAEPRRHIPSGKLLTSCTVPLVRAGSKADERSIWGTVVDPNGNPVAGAMIVCLGVRTPGGGNMHTPDYDSCRAVTDQQGRFYMYLPIDKDSDKHGNLVPLASKYLVRIEPPKALNLHDYSGFINSGEETTVTMRTVGRFRTFIFEDEFGPVTDPNMLKRIKIEIELDSGGKRGNSYDHWMSNRKFLPGMYHASADWNGKRYIFGPIKLTEESPETIIFKSRVIKNVDIVYQGQVVHGITGKPMPEAIIMKKPSRSDIDTSGLESKQIRDILVIGPELVLDDSVFGRLKESFKSTMITRTDSNGDFQITLPTSTGKKMPSTTIIAMQKDFLGARQNLCYTVPADANKSRESRWKVFQPNENGCVTLPPMRLFPAGTIIIEPNVPAEAENKDVILSWFTFTDHNPEWLEDLCDYTYANRHKGGSLFYKYFLQPNQIETVYVAAGVEMTIKVHLSTESRLGPIVVPGVKLEQGQILDLGRRDFPPTFKVAVKVIDSSGEPVEGVTVKCSDEIGTFMGQKVITNEGGIAFPYVSPHSKGKFTVQHYEEPLPAEPLRESTVYEVAGEEDAGKQFVLRISDEMLYQLFKIGAKMMKRTCIFSFFLALLFSLAAPAGDLERQARELAEEVLTGRELRVRVYNNWREDPKEYKHVSVKLDGLSFGHNAVKAAFPGIGKSAVLVVAGQDQTDEAVTAMTADFVCAGAYGAGKKLSIWPSLSSIRDHKDCVFTDALGYPIPKASVEMLFRGGFANSREIYLGGAVLDEEGRLRPPILGGGIYRYIFVISHPKYGKAAVEKHRSGRKPDDYDDSVARYVVPLVPMDSEAGTRAIQGYVVDNEGIGIEGVSLECTRLRTANDSRIRAHTGTYGRSITNEQGWFAMYKPIDKDGVLSEDLIPVDAEYYLRATPPEPFLMYEHRTRGVAAGGAGLITLASTNQDEHFHTFKFEDEQGMITEPRELQKIGVRHTQDEREWQGIKYDEWKDGCYLQEGTLHASTRRWGDNFNFKPIKVTDDSPEELVFKTYEAIIYRGRVIDALTGEPMPKVLVLVDHSYSRKDPSALTPQHWERLYMQAAEESATGPRDKKLYEYRDRVTVTDANGCYELVFMPGFTTQLWTFKAVEKGFVPKPADASQWEPNANGIVEVPTIELLNPEAMKATHLPVLVFEDPSGAAITDPNILDHIRFTINVGDGSRRECPLSTLMNSRRLTPGIYQPTVDWEDCHYVFEQVEVTEDSPQEIVFKIKEVGLPEVTYRGRVIHGITGTPMRGAIVMSQNALDEGDASNIRPEQWEAIHSMGPEFDPNNQALTPLRQAFGYQKITRADAAGQFQLTVERKETPMRGRLITTEQDYLGTRQKLSYMTPIDKDSPEPIRYKEFEPDENGHVTLPPMKLFPAGTIIIEPNIPYVEGSREEAWFHFRTAEDDPTPWLNDFWATARSTRGGGVVYRYTLRPHYIQRVYVPAGVELTLKIVPRQSQRAPVTIGGVKLEQGRVHDLGRIDFPETFKVAVKVISSAGEPVKGVTVLCQGADGFVSGLRSITDESGMVKLDVAPSSNGQFIVRYFDRSTGTEMKEGTPYEVAGEEDAGKQFVLRISDEMFYQLLKGRSD